MYISMKFLTSGLARSCLISLRTSSIRKKASFEPEKFRDQYQEAVINLICSKQAGKPAQVAHVSRPNNVINLMDALRRSLGPAKNDRPKSKKPRAAAINPKSGRRAAGSASPSRDARRKGRIKKAS